MAAKKGGKDGGKGQKGSGKSTVSGVSHSSKGRTNADSATPCAKKPVKPSDKGVVVAAAGPPPDIELDLQDGQCAICKETVAREGSHRDSLRDSCRGLFWNQTGIPRDGILGTRMEFFEMEFFEMGFLEFELNLLNWNFSNSNGILRNRWFGIRLGFFEMELVEFEMNSLGMEFYEHHEERRQHEQA